MDYGSLLGFSGTNGAATEKYWPHPLIGRDFVPESALPNAQRTSGFRDHALRHPPEFKSGPSKAPGNDYDVRIQTEGLNLYLRPVVTSSVAGTVFSIRESVGGVGIRDKNGWEHWFLHLGLNNLGPSDGKIFSSVEVGKSVQIGTPLGFLDNVGTSRDHLHMHFRSPEDGKLYDPDNLLFGKDGEVTVIKSQERAEIDIWLQSEHMRRMIIDLFRDEEDDMSADEVDN